MGYFRAVFDAKEFPRGRRGWYAGVAVLVAAVVGIAVALWATRDSEPRARQYLDFTACLLTDDGGIAGPEAAAVWAGMQKASLATRAKVRYLAVAGEQSTENAVTFLASLAQSECSLVFAVGDVPRAAVDAGAARFPKVQFAAVGRARAAPNVSTINATDVSERLADAVDAAE
jgi:basic membrane lipoprotein Med (substrate-binding protein (PBP1-ABC) superfamily)